MSHARPLSIGEERKNNVMDGRFHLIFNLFMIIVYALVGIFFLFILRVERFSASNLKLIGGVVLLYAAYRGYKLFRENRDNEKV